MSKGMSAAIALHPISLARITRFSMLLVKIEMANNNCQWKTMSTVERIEAEILKLSPKELTQLTDRVLALNEQAWDEQIEQDIAQGN